LISRRASLGILIALAVAMAFACCLLPRIPQPLSYHQFADRRSLLGIANFGDVVSNLPFALVGIWGLVFLFQAKSREDRGRFLDRRERWPYFFVFAGLLLTAFGSSYYHLASGCCRFFCLWGWEACCSGTGARREAWAICASTHRSKPTQRLSSCWRSCFRGDIRERAISGW